MSDSVPPGPDQYNQDGLVTIHNHDFIESPTFKAAYQRGVKAAGTDCLGKQFYLLDMLRGIDQRYVSNEELASGVIDQIRAAIDPSFYVAGFQSVRANVSG